MKTKPQTKSARADGRGGWIPGKRRHLDVGDWQRIRIDLVALLDAAYRRGIRSRRALGIRMGVSEKTVRRWLSGEDRPSPEAQEALRAWLKEQRQAIAAEKARR